MNRRTHRNFDLEVGESVTFDLLDHTGKTVRLIELSEPQDSVRGVIRKPVVTVEVDGERRRIVSAHYRMPVVVGGVRLDCPATRGLALASAGKKSNVFALERAARLRCWDPATSLFGERPMVYPLRQAWLASMSQMANERVYVDAGELGGNPPGKGVYHHSGHDFGGFDRAVPILAAAPGRIITLGERVAEGEAWPLANPRPDVIHIRGEDGRHFRYSHLDMLAVGLEPGGRVEAGQFLGFLGQEGGSGGWSHLHFHIHEQMPSGGLGAVDAYPFIVEAYLNEHPGALLACARPHQVGDVGDPVELDGSNSICDGGQIVDYRWTCQDGREMTGPTVTRTYDSYGMYSEILTVTDDRGKTDVDFCVVQIVPRDLDPAKTPPAMSLNYHPTLDLRPGQQIAFEARTFFRGPAKENAGGFEEWDFGDGTRATTRSNDNYPEHRHDGYAQRWHAYDRPGRYVVTVSRAGKNGLAATARLKVEIGG